MIRETWQEMCSGKEIRKTSARFLFHLQQVLRLRYAKGLRLDCRRKSGSVFTVQRKHPKENISLARKLTLLEVKRKKIAKKSFGVRKGEEQFNVIGKAGATQRDDGS